MKRDDLAPAVASSEKSALHNAVFNLREINELTLHGIRWNMEIHVPFDCVLIKVKQPLFKDKTFSKLRRGFWRIFSSTFGRCNLFRFSLFPFFFWPFGQRHQQERELNATTARMQVAQLTF